MSSDAPIPSAERFTARGKAYAGARPGYPAAAIDLLFAGFADPRELTVADLGAGTGIASRLIAARGAHVYAVEASDDMRRAARAAERIEYIAAMAEATGLAAQSVDLVTAFQAYHWFHPQHAVAEMLRILKSDGRAALAFNLRDESDPQTAVFAALLRRHTIASTESSGEFGRNYFATHPSWKSVRKIRIPGEHVLDKAALHRLCASISYLPQHGRAQDELGHDLDRYFCECASGDIVRLQMITELTIADLAERP